MLDITESTVDFNLPTKWTQQEYDEMLYYCEHDVDALRPLFEARKDYFETKYDICKLCNIDPKENIGLTNAKLCAKFLEAKMIKRNDERDYILPKTIDLKYIDERIKNFFKRIYDLSIPSEELFKTKLEYDEHGMPTVISWGGKHGALPNFIFVQEEHPDMICINADYESLYPHILALEEYNTISRNIKDSKAYYNTLQNRLRLKHEGKKKEQLALKLILNTTYGCELNQYNDLYDPRGARSTCINGQLLISELTERIYEIGDVTLVQVNTDGVMVLLPKDKLDEYYKVCNEFSKKVKINLEFDVIDKIIQRDVNNYILYMKDKDGYKIKAKGGIFSNLPKLLMDNNKIITSKYTPNFKTNTMSIVSEAIARYLLVETPVEETINNCNDIFRFQMISHLGGTYEKCVQESPNGDIELQRNNRIYAGLQSSGRIIKIKPDGRRDQLPNCPKNPIVDNDNKVTIEMINKKWYIKYAKQQISEFVGRKEIYMEEKLDTLKKAELIEMIKKMKEKEEMKEDTFIKATPLNTEHIEYIDPTPKLYQKIIQLRKLIRERNFILDKALPSNLGGGEYVSIEQYYQAIQDISLEVGLDFSFEILNVERFDLAAFKPQTGAPQNIATVRCLFIFTDVDTGMTKSYTEISQGSDTVDKAVNGASTLAFRNWFDKNFTPSVFNGEKVTFGEDDTNISLDGVNIPNQAKGENKPPKVFVTPEKKEQIKEEIVNTPQVTNNEDDIKKLTELIYTYRELSGDDTKGAKTLQAIIDGTITDTEILSKTLSFENAIEKLKGE